MNVPHLRIAVYLILVCLCACHKPDFPTQSTYTFHNQTGKKITFDLYSTKEDYNQNTNRTSQYIIENGGDAKLTLEIGSTYWVDWYTPDYSYNNWNVGQNAASPTPELQVAAVDDRRDFTPRSFDTIRSVMLNGGDISSYWKGTGAVGTGYEGTHEFRFRKDLSCEYVYTDLGGNTNSMSFNYSINSMSTTGGRTSAFSLRISNPFTEQVSFIAFCYLSNSATLTGRNTLRITPYQSSSSTELSVQRQ